MTDALPPSSPRPEGAVRIAHSSVIRAVGPDAAGFLNSQLTNDVSGLALGDARLAAYCSPKGRMLAAFVAFKRSHEEFWLACRNEVLPATLKRLRMFVLRAKVQLVEAGDAVVLLGLAGAAAQAWLGEAAGSRPWTRREHGSACVVRLPDAAGQPRWLWAGPTEDAGAVLRALPALSLADWDWLELRSGIAPVLAATVDAFVPQMLNYELVGGVSFQKGCYPGQEIVARSQYRGTLKRRTVLVHAEAEMQAGQEVWWSGDATQPSGLVAVSAPAPGGGHDALIEVKLAALDHGSLQLGAAAGAPLALLPLPYALPREAATA